MIYYGDEVNYDIVTIIIFSFFGNMEKWKYLK